MKINKQLIIVFLIITFISILSIGLLSFNIGKSTLEEKILTQLEVIAELKVERINSFFDERRGDIETAQGYYNIQKNLPIVNKFAHDRTNPEYLIAKAMLDDQLKVFQEVYGYIDIMLVNLEGKIIYVTNKEHTSKDLDMHLPDPTEGAFEEGQKSVYFSEIFRNPTEGFNFGMLITAPAYDLEGNFIGVIALETDMNIVYDFIQDTTGLGETGETLIGKRMKSHAGQKVKGHLAEREGDHILFLNPLRHDPEAALEREVYLDKDKEIAIPMQKATQGRRGSGESIDYRNEPILAAWMHIPSLDWGLVAKIDKTEAFAPITKLRNNIIIMTLVLAILVSALAYYFSRTISKPIILLSESAKQIGGGKLETQIKIRASNEIGQLAQSLEEMRKKLKTSRAQLVEKKQLEELNKKLEKAYVNIKSLDKEKDQFISLISHELKSPLIPIMGYIELMLGGEVGKLTSEQKEKLQICYHNASNLKNLIDDFLDLSRLDLKRLKLNFSNENLTTIAKEVKDALTSLAQEKNAEIIIITPEKTIVEIDHLRITQVITNLVKNSILYGKEGQHNKIEVTIKKEEKNIKVSIKDQGQGIPKDKIGKLFNKFYRAEQATRSSTTGTGLGLVITKGIVELHNGKMSVESKEGVGSTFSFTLPLKHNI